MKTLGIDFGDSRTGFAVSDELGFGAATLPNFKSGSIVKGGGTLRRSGR